MRIKRLVSGKDVQVPPEARRVCTVVWPPGAHSHSRTTTGDVRPYASGHAAVAPVGHVPDNGNTRPSEGCYPPSLSTLLISVRWSAVSRGSAQYTDRPSTVIR